MSLASPPFGVVLAGGSSSRLGRDKAVIEIDGLPLVERAARRLDTCCERTLIADGGRLLTRAEASVPDGPGRGPVAGVLGAAAAAPGRALLVLACDQPLVPPSLLETLATASDKADWVVPRHGGRLEPLCALYRPAAIEALRLQVEAGNLALHSLAQVDGLEIEFLDETELGAHGQLDEMFANLNRPGDLEAIARLLEID